MAYEELNDRTEGWGDFGWFVDPDTNIRHKDDEVWPETPVRQDTRPTKIVVDENSEFYIDGQKDSFYYSAEDLGI